MKYLKIIIVFLALFAISHKVYAVNSNNITTWQASQGYVDSIQSQLNALHSQVPPALGTAGQALFVGTLAQSGWYSFSGDFTCSAVTPGLCTLSPIANLVAISATITNLTATGAISITGTSANGTDVMNGVVVNGWVTPQAFAVGTNGAAGITNTTSTTAGTTNGVAAVTLASATNFYAGQEIMLLNAGQPTALLTPGAPSVTPYGAAGGTRYDYEIVACDQNGGCTAAGPGGNTTTGNAALVTANGNALAWTAVAGAAYYLVYKSTDSGATYALWQETALNSLNDAGQSNITTVSNVSNWWPATPGAAINQHLITTISVLVGTIATLANSPGATLGAAIVVHSAYGALSAAIISATANKQGVILPAGAYNAGPAKYNFTHNQIVIKGEQQGIIGFGLDTWATKINTWAGNYFIDTANKLTSGILVDFSHNGGYGLFRSTFGGAETGSSWKRFVGLSIQNFTGAAIETTDTDQAFWEVGYNTFMGYDINQSMCLALGERGSSTSHIHNNVIQGCRVDIKTHKSAQDDYIDYNFISHANQTNGTTHNPYNQVALWIPPDGAVTNGGGVIDSNRFGSEFSASDDYKIIFTDELSGNSGFDPSSATHASWGNKFPDFTTTSTGNITGPTIINNHFQTSSSSITMPAIFTTTNVIDGLYWNGNELQNGITYIIQYLTGTTLAGVRRNNNYFGPTFQSANDESSSLVTLLQFSNAGLNAGVLDDPVGATERHILAPVTIPGAESGAEYLTLLTTGISAFTRSNATLVGGATADWFGTTDAQEFNFSLNSGNLVTNLTNTASVRAGEPLWFEFYLKKGSATPLTGLDARVEVSGGYTAYRNIFEISSADTNWHGPYRIPFSIADSSLTYRILFRPVSASAETGNVVIGNVRVYRGREPLNAAGVSNYSGFRLQNLLAANLPATAPEGDLRFCTDCTIATPCVTGGTGRLAERANGVWSCP